MRVVDAQSTRSYYLERWDLQEEENLLKRLTSRQSGVLTVYYVLCSTQSVPSARWQPHKVRIRRVGFQALTLRLCQRLQTLFHNLTTMDEVVTLLCTVVTLTGSASAERSFLSSYSAGLQWRPDGAISIVRLSDAHLRVIRPDDFCPHVHRKSLRFCPRIDNRSSQKAALRASLCTQVHSTYLIKSC